MNNLFLFAIINYIETNRKYTQGESMSYTSASFYMDDDNLAYIERKIKNKKRYNKSNWLNDLVDHLRLKEDKTKTDLVMVYPENLNRDAWDEWLIYRKKLKFKVYKTDKKMIALSEQGNHETQMKIVQYSIENEYQGLFPLHKKTGTSNSVNVKKELDDESWADDLDNVL